MPRLITSAFDPVRADPQLFVDRAELREELEAILEDLIVARRFQARLTITGEKGVGKTILTRAVLRAVHERLKDPFLLVEVDGRGLAYRPFLERLARTLAEEGIAWLNARAPMEGPGLRRWLEELALLAIQRNITEAETSSIARAYGTDTGVEGGLLGALHLKALFKWTETRQLGQAIQRSREITDTILHAAIETTLVHLMEREVPVVLFMNDLDQALNREDPALLRQVLGQMVALEPCIQVLNVRREILYDDLRRESDVTEVPAMPPVALMDLFDRRIGEEPDPAKQKALRSPALREVAEQLSQVNGNPFAFLSWLQAFLRLFDAPYPSLLDFHVRQRVVIRTGAPDDPDLIEQLVQMIERIGSHRLDWCTRDDLLRGTHSLDAHQERGLTESEVSRLILGGVLVPRDVFAPERGLRMEPMLDLLRQPAARR